MSDRNKIAQELSVDALDEFVRELAAMPGKSRTLAAIQARAATLGIEISLMSAKAFRDTTFARHLQRLGKAQELAMQVASLGNAGAGATLADAGAAILSQEIFDELTAGGELDLDKLSLCLSRIRRGDQQAAALRAKIEDYERRWREAEEKKAKASEEMERLRNPTEALTDDDRRAIVAKVDEILGLK